MENIIQNSFRGVGHKTTDIIWEALNVPGYENWYLCIGHVLISWIHRLLSKLIFAECSSQLLFRAPWSESEQLIQIRQHRDDKIHFPHYLLFTWWYGWLWCCVCWADGSGGACCWAMPMFIGGPALAPICCGGGAMWWMWWCCCGATCGCGKILCIIFLDLFFNFLVTSHALWRIFCGKTAKKFTFYCNYLPTNSFLFWLFRRKK